MDVPKWLAGGAIADQAARPRALDVIVYGGTAALGLILHFVIAFGMGAAYWLACLRWPSLIAKPVAAGITYGILTWFAMNYVIVPLSRAGPLFGDASSSSSR